VGHCGALAALDWGSKGARVADDGGQWWRRRSGEGVELGKGKCCAKRRTAASKQDHRVVVGCVLRPGTVLRVLTGAGNDDEGVTAGGGSGMRGARKGGQQGRGTGPQKGEDDEWGPSQQEVEERRRQSGGEKRGTAPAAGGQSRARAQGRRREGRGSGGPV
jgi:hypothetical protein